MARLHRLTVLVCGVALILSAGGCGGGGGAGVDDLGFDGQLIDVADSVLSDVGFNDLVDAAEPEPAPDEVVPEPTPEPEPVDVAEPEPPDVVEVEAVPEIVEVPAGTLCEDDTACGSKKCLNHLCVQPCGDGCDEGWECLVSQGKGYCFPAEALTCRLCLTDQDCSGELSEVPYRCVPQEGFLVCVHTCKAHSECPSGSCVAVPESPGSKVCQAVGCDCTDTDANAGAEGSCFHSNAWGTCWGLAQCLSDGSRSCAALEPGREYCNGADDNCDGATDEGFLDQNGDGVADCAALSNDPDDDGVGAGDNCPTVWNPWQENMDLDAWGDACDPDTDGDGVENGADCEPANPLAFPGALERCNGIDDDCDTGIDEGFPDTNGDGVPDCGLPSDADFDGILDVQDNCLTVPNPDQHDLDHDGTGDACDPNIDGDPALNADDCDDFDAASYPGAIESCDGHDNDCNGQTDEGFKDSDGDDQADCVDLDDDNDGVDDADDDCPLVGNPDQADLDGDGLGNACDDDRDGDGIANAADDCPDAKNSIQKDSDGDGLGDACDPDRDGDLVPNADDNCPDVVNLDQADLDGDGLGDACDADLDGDGYVPPADCDDLDPAISPAAEEICDGVDNNCDDWADSDPGLPDCTTFYFDSDKDGFGGAATQCLCQPSSQFSTAVGGDCNDQNATIWPGATELCDSIDNNCNGTNNEGFTDTDADGQANCVDSDDDGDGRLDLTDNCPLVPNADQKDSDGDGKGDACSIDIDGDGDPNTTDCGPDDPSVHHGATEACNARDDDCDGLTDEVGAAGCVPHYADVDGDLYGSGAASCRCAPSDAYPVARGGDCDDADALANPGAAERCNGVDDDCDGKIDEGCDGDGDGWCAKGSQLQGNPQACPNGAGDCDDTRADIHPGAVEVCNGRDDDCNDKADEGCDDDGDGYCDVAMTVLTVAACPYGGGDCNDASNLVNPGVFDPPDLAFADANCDGIDGGLATSVFVDALAGTPTGSGAADDPLDTIQAGVALAGSTLRTAVLVAGGDYTGQLVMKGGVGVYGGYGGVADGWEVRETSRAARLSGPSQAVVAANVFSPTALQLVAVSAALDAASGSSVALFVRNAGSYLTVEACSFESAPGADGADGVAGATGGAAGAGGNGVGGCQEDCGWPGGGGGGASPCGRTGGAGGASGSANDAGKAANGASGAVSNQGGGAGGVGGNNASGGKWGNGSAASGAPGAAGAQGTNGASGAVPSGSGWLDSTGWHLAAAANGVDGGHGHGGGGGGGGGGFSVDWESADLFGGGGGGGGGGGCGGTAGTGGVPGGSSIGVVLLASSPVLRANTITVGAGGMGGAGKAGGGGGLGAGGGAGGGYAHAWNVNSGTGGAGAAGGNGGKGGDGAGGCGGNSVGILRDGLSTPILDSNTIVPGAAGAGGAGGNATNAGCPGKAAETAAP